MNEPLEQGATVGILGGGQLGRMLSVAAARLGYRCHIFEPDPNAPAAHVADQITCAGYDDVAALRAFAATVDVITFEFENIPAAALDLLETLTPVRPNRRALTVSQDRNYEKKFLQDLGLCVAPFALVDNVNDLNAALAKIKTPALLKTRRFGYDGKGQIRVDADTNAARAYGDMKNAPCVLEGLVNFTQEVSVIGARSISGQIACYDPGENVHRNGILRNTTVPAKLTIAQRTDAVLLTAKILNALNYTGVLGVELFVTGGGLIVNEFAPRVHNSGHWTQNGCSVDQFEQHIRAITGWPLGDGTRHCDIEMINLIGNDIDKIPALAADPDNALHLYGKTQVRPGRKMGHVNRIRS